MAIQIQIVIDDPSRDFSAQVLFLWLPLLEQIMIY